MFKKFQILSRIKCYERIVTENNSAEGRGQCLRNIYLQTKKNIQAGKILQLLMFCFDDTEKF